MKIKFDNSQQWLAYTKKSLVDFFWALLHLLWMPIVSLISLGFYLKSVIGAFCRREPLAMTFISALIALLVAGWIATFTSERTRAMKAEYERDSVSIVLSRYQDSIK